jgi:hypothetical protein
MASGEMSGVKRFLLWDYPRASWQYDVMVAIILAFVFLTPREMFRDQPRPSSIVEVPSTRGRAFLLEAGLLETTPQNEQTARVEDMLRARYGKTGPVVQVEPILDAEKELKGFMVFTRP